MNGEKTSLLQLSVARFVLLNTKTPLEQTHTYKHTDTSFLGNSIKGS